MGHRPKPRRWQRPQEIFSAEHKLVKSASRVFRILEYLDDVRRPTTVMEIAEALGYPQSSTSALLSSMVAMGYLVFEPHKRTYLTSSRVALLGNWVNEPFFAEGRMIAAMKALFTQFGQTVALGMRNGRAVQYIHILQAPIEERHHVPIGYSTPMVLSASGRAMMAAMPSDEVTRIALRYNAEAGQGASLLSLRELQDDLVRVRERGHAAIYDRVVKGGCEISVRLPQIAGQRPMALSVWGASALLRPREEEIALALVRETRDGGVLAEAMDENEAVTYHERRSA